MEEMFHASCALRCGPDPNDLGDMVSRSSGCRHLSPAEEPRQICVRSTFDFFSSYHPTGAYDKLSPPIATARQPPTMASRAIRPLSHAVFRVGASPYPSIASIASSSRLRPDVVRRRLASSATAHRPQTVAPSASSTPTPSSISPTGAGAGAGASPGESSSTSPDPADDPAPDPDPSDSSPPPGSAYARFRALTKKYGWYAVGMYGLLSLIDFPLTFLFVHSIGPERIQPVLHSISHTYRTTIHGADEAARIEAEAAERAAQARLDDTRAEPSGWHRYVSARTLSEAAVAYAIHKTVMLPVRAGLTVAWTPRVVEWMTARGWVGKVSPRAKRAKRAKRAVTVSFSPLPLVRIPASAITVHFLPTLHRVIQP